MAVTEQRADVHNLRNKVWLHYGNGIQTPLGGLSDSWDMLPWIIKIWRILIFDL